ncbi:hypothetical protein GT037_005517 [Alternaria burnsii]|uniref:NACHT domain-containing protein n=1 Tax=Alternaria burnsii TaxID=1187904 RepID=A0A8H7EEU7_9PLEO|nr:uncharacterized protein GT037_005517 [Alternaria burnsii]KAF7676012.1 hypothetical protein GT037_005517 [Alternaria burnsii]
MVVSKALAKASAKASSLKPEIRLAQALSEFEASLTQEQKTTFRTLKSQSVSTAPTPSDVMRLTAEVDRRMSKKFSGQCFGPRFTNFLQGVQQFAALGDVVVGGSQNLIACGVWSLVRMSLLSIVSMSNYVDSLSSIFMDIGRSTPRHQAISVLYPQSTKLQSYLSEYFIVVVALCRYLFNFGQKSILQQFTSSLNDGDLRAFRTDLDKWALSITNEMQFNEAQESSGFRALSRSMFKSASHQQKFATKNRVLDFCSTYDHEIVWKQTRKAGNTSLYTHFVEYEKWRDSSHSCTLICTGKLGSGKSVLLANIVDDLNLSTEKERPLVTYFFCRHDIPESLQARVILGSLARQLLRTVDDHEILLDTCEDTHTSGDTDKILELILQGYPPDHKAYFVIDGLDECDDEERRVLVQAIGEIQGKLNVLVCASFRVEPNNGLQSITHHLLSTRIVPLPEKNPDIDAFIEADLRRCLDQELLTIGDATLIIDIQDALVAGSQGMFLWAALQIRSLCGMKTDHDIREALTDLPQNLSETFTRILYKSGSPDRPLQAKTLQLVLTACRPLTTGELREALSVTPSDTTWDPSRLLNNVHSALAYCGCLLTVDEEESTVRVVHHSVKQYFLHGLDDARHIGFTIEDAQVTMADIVITYLAYGVFETQMTKTAIRPIMARSAPSRILQSTMGSSSTRQLAMRLLGSRKQPTFDLSKTLAEARGSSNAKPEHVFTFYAYAKTYWQDHIWYVSGKDHRIHKLSVNLIETRRSELRALDTFSGMKCRRAAKHNMRLLNLLYQEHRTPHGQIEEMQYTLHTPLMWAIHHGDRDAVETLLKAGIDVNDGGGFSRVDWDFSEESIIQPTLTPLIQAVRRKDKDIVELLLENDKLDLNARDSERRTALEWALKRRDDDIIKLLLNDDRTGFDGTLMGGMTPLTAAASQGDKDIIQLFLGNSKVYIGQADTENRTALMMAALNGHKDVVKLLLATYDASVSSWFKESTKGIPSHRHIEPATRSSYINAADDEGKTALMMAASNGHEDVVELLLATNDVNINHVDMERETAWDLAREHKNIVEMLQSYSLRVAMDRLGKMIEKIN